MASGGAVLGVRQPGWTVFQIQTPGGRYLKYRPPWGPSSRSIGHVRSRSDALQRGRRQVLTPETVRVHPRGGRRGPLARSLGRGDWRRRRRLEICFSETPRSLSLGRSCCCRQSRELLLPWAMAVAGVRPDSESTTRSPTQRRATRGRNRPTCLLLARQSGKTR